MKIIFLGTGTSTGVPEIGCHCEVCSSDDPRDRRLRSSILVETDGKRILLDCGPDFRWQMLKQGIEHLDAVLLSHEHYDHVGGLDDLRPFVHKNDLKIYAEKNVVQAIQTRLPYAFREHPYPGVPQLNLQSIGLEAFEAAGIPVQPVRVMHGLLPIQGFRIGKMAYLTDLKTLPESSYEYLFDLDILILDALRPDSRHFSHEGLDEALQQIERIKPKSAYLIHMSHRIGLHHLVEKSLPRNVFLAYDGLIVQPM